MIENINKFQFIMEVLNLIILFVVLRKLLFKPVTEFMEKRTNAIKASIDDAEAQKTAAYALKAQYEQQLSEAKGTMENMIDEATAKANRRSEQIIAAAQEEAGVLLANARVEIERERQKMLREIRVQVVELAIGAASKVVESNMDTGSNKVIVDKFLDEAGAA
ncbi:MAG: synthase, subunit b [Oscillospiraceae bacterium]|nr:synthase, subunit b [Oscillospiraceae bacterium]